MRLGRPVLFAALTAAMVAAGVMATCNAPRTVTSVGQAVPQCGRCHGGADNFAPPRTPLGGTDTKELGVGAHQTHVRAGPLREAIPCQECHVVPAREDDPGHIDKDHGDVTFGALASANGAKPAWSRGTATCSNVYCHGATLPGGSRTAPVWTQVDGSQVACGACHAAPPAPETGHPTVTGGLEACSSCHPDTVRPDGTIDVASGRHVNGRVDLGALGCTSCHGDKATGGAAPPRGTKGETATSARAVGAHQQHLKDGPLRQAIACAECHAVPTDLSHVNGTVQLTWGSLARAGSAAPSWDGARCSGVYCHGATLQAGGSSTAPIWTKVDGTQAACGTCHALPPPPESGHPPVTGGVGACGMCHPGITPAGAIDVAAGKHINGVVDVKDLSCTSCHGDPGRAVNAPAPPRGTRGETATTSIAIGAHQQHLEGGRLRAGIACTECHVVPTSTSHTNGKVELTFGPLATAAGANPAWDRAGATCSGVYCHGATLNAGGTSTAPVWTRVDGSQIACGTCHAAPPPVTSGHPAVAGGLPGCNGCHGDTVKPDGTIDVARGKHMNGTIDIAGVSCTSCHGNATTGSPAPPRGTHGETATTDLAVGAHASHLTNSAVRAAIGCNECHVLPSSIGHSNGRVDVTFGPLATTGGATPAWSRATASCSTVYCHGATLAGGAATQPVWTRVDGSQATCTSCHGQPPPTSSGHPPVTGGATACARCHPATVKPDGTIDVAGGRHLNGAVDVIPLSCTSCHGDPARPANPAAPPSSTTGESATTARGVGAHQAHLAGGPIRQGIACGECHTVPTSTSHANGAVEVKFGATANARGAVARWDGATCSTYCHGATLGGGSLTSPTWTRVDGSQARCGTCHGLPPPPSTGHPAIAGGVTTCAGCHPGTVDASGNIVVSGGLHVNGVVDVANLSCTSCHGDAARVVNAPAPPRGTRGETATSARAVGAHQQHLADSALRRALECADCHVVPTSTTHTNGVVEVTFGALARTNGAAPAWNGTTCSNVYCHGSFRNGNAANAPAWTRVDGTQGACGTCHGIPPGGTHPQGVTACGSCHGTGYSQTTVNLGLHMNGAIDVANLSCTSCHGDPARARNPAAPPKGTRGEATADARAVGAHQSHVQASPLRDAVNCSECHPVPTSTSHSNGQVDIAFGPLATAGGAKPVWSGGTCAATYCHGGFKNGNTTNAPVWTRVDGSQAACGTCHGIPPGGTHPQGVTNCATCHPGYTQTSVATATHLNGTVDVNLTCTACHGTPGANPAPPAGTKGETATSARAVGAHQAHLGDSNLRAALECADCHVVPTSTSHSNGAVEVTFGALARTGGAAATWNGTTCSGVYCHGAFKNGNSGNAPVWTKVDGSQAACGTCHGIPPGGTHPQGVTNCGGCHGAAYSPTTVNVATHMNGTVDVANLTCTSCHGSSSNPAPPSGTKGETATSARAVGAHQKHLADSAFRAALGCADCHVVPTSTSHSNGTVEVTFGALARTGGAAATWNGATCSGVYCHGAFKNGNSGNAPVWTRVDGSQGACGTCHGIPPGGTHPQGVTNCAGCHGAGYSPTTVNLAVHMNGTVDVANLTCTSCHGSSRNPAPPSGTKGETSTSARAVGAHQQHLADSAFRAALGCADCHVVPTSTSHSNGTVEVAFGALARTGGAAATWNGATCSGVYCHGAFKNGNSGNAPIWTRVDGSQGACGTCHAIPPGGTHPQGVTNCGGCHGAGYSQTTVNLAVHMNGTVDVANLTCTSCHGSSNPAPPSGTKGETSTSARAVGAHQTHVNAGPLAAAFDCSACHVKPTSTSHSNGKVEIAFGALASQGTTAAWNGTSCATYCHGATLSGGRNTNPAWTTVNGSQAACGACHGIAPPTGQHGRDDHVKAGCGVCHAGYTSSSVNVGTHVNGSVNLGGSRIKSYDPATKSCSPACHETKRWTGGRD